MSDMEAVPVRRSTPESRPTLRPDLDSLTEASSAPCLEASLWQPEPSP